MLLESVARQRRCEHPLVGLDGPRYLLDSVGDGPDGSADLRQPLPQPTIGQPHRRLATGFDVVAVGVDVDHDVHRREVIGPPGAADRERRVAVDVRTEGHRKPEGRRTVGCGEVEGLV